MKQIEVQIMGNGYLLGVPEGGEVRLHTAVKRVDSAMCRIRDAGKLKARDRIAVLAALNLAFDLADRDGPATLAAVPNRAVTSPVPTAATAEGSASEPSDPRLEALVQRLDSVLGGDGRLL